MRNGIASSSEPAFCRIYDAPGVLGVSAQTLRNWNKDGLPLYRRDGATLVDVREFREFLQRYKNRVVPPRCRKSDNNN